MITIDPIKRPPKKSSSINTEEIMKEVDLRIADALDGSIEIPLEYVTKSELEAKGYLTSHQDISHLATQSLIPTKVSQLENDSNYIRDLLQVYTINTCDCLDLQPHGWSNINFTRITKNVEGESIPMYEIKVETKSTSGNLFGFTRPGLLQENEIGERFNYYILLYSPISVELRINKYPDFSDLNSFLVWVKPGWNEFHWSGIVDNINYSTHPEVYFSETLECIGKTFYAKCLFYKGKKRNFLADLKSTFVEKEEGKELIDVYLIDKIKKLDQAPSLKNQLIYKNIVEHSGGSLCTFTNEDGIISYSKEAGKGSEEGFYCYIDFKLDDGYVWKKNHSYYIALDVLVEKDSNSGDLISLDTTPKFNNSNVVGVYTFKERPKVGQRGLLKTIVEINKEDTIDLYPLANWLFVQLGGKYNINSYFSLKIYNILVIDLGLNGSEDYVPWSDFDVLVNNNGILNSYISKNVYEADIAKKLSIKDIELWGDSLTALKYGNYISGAIVYTHGYGSKTSTYIRDEFLKNHNPNRTQVIWVGRNNYTETDVIIDDIRDIVSTLKHNDFVIMNPPNGYYGEFGTNGEDGTGEMKGGNGHSKFLELEKRLSEEYPSNFLNIRKAVIEGWRMGNVRLLSDFTQPSVGSNVTIEVSDANFLTTYNSYDESKFGHDFVAKIRIGVNSSYDVYKIVEKVDDTHLTVQLEESNRIAVGSTVGNLIDSGGNSAVKYLRVMQNADYMCWLYDTTLSTFRKDGIHMTEDGLKLVALIVSRKLASMKLL